MIGLLNGCFFSSSDDRVRAISLAMGMVPVLWTSTPGGGKFDSFGNVDYAPSSLSGLRFVLFMQIGESLVEKLLARSLTRSSRIL